MLIRPVEPTDLDAVGLITVSASHSAFVGVIPEEAIDFTWTPATSAANWRRFFHDDVDPDRRFFVAEDDGRVVGYVWVSPGADTTGLEWSVRGLYVLPTRQRQGIGRRLMAFVADLLDEAGVNTLEIGCVKENPSCGFYDALAEWRWAVGQ